MHSTRYRRLSVTILAILITSVSACSPDGPEDVQAGTHAPSASPQQIATPSAMPPGFLDEPPAPPTSSTLVLSGGTLMAEDTIADSVIVLTQGELVAWGERGAVTMPNDSIGRDMRSKWLIPGSEADLAAGELPNLDHFIAGTTAAILIFDEEPTAPWSDEHLIGTLVRGTLTLADEP